LCCVGVYNIKIGGYRITYALAAVDVLILRIKYRSNAYG
jgi:mRNA-degrading endonuclease RelE of RelBE toxin-antitoxin system